MPRRTLSLPKAVDDIITSVAHEGESYSAAAARLIEAGARQLRRGHRPPWIGAGSAKSLPKDFARNYEEYMAQWLDKL
ncbi:MAG: hypothetical protein ABR525_09945 [Candidatus Limnocylindria bacterium]